ncbi:glycerophosphodiester phosphodiesterase [Paenibacillus sp. J22TS3]|uniref:glycerophosphodiester phosphodiesterase n=1 Tax=Paenibacillus sp. J22TS3 TaxID=2807192 RepID=UPI001B2662A1|nr:glycerophosphodiester phosphodiesterase [Paenibacillus sp. J22TS3]GIP22122.1 glycerophosphoryl diester phosphodiesterase [Paenibacillus sp. J22TS3]
MKIIGHRGAAGHAPENTLKSIVTALNQGVQGIEIDAQLTKDNHVVIIHDFTVDRTTNGRGKIHELTLEEIRSLDAGSAFRPEFGGELVPTLEEILELIPSDVLLNVELKQIAYERRNLEEKVAEAIAKYNLADHTIISSFDHYSLKRIHEIDPTLQTGLLTYTHMLNPWKYIQDNGLNVYSIHPAYEFLTREYVTEIHQHGYKIYCYTVNDAVTGQTLEDFGVDGIITDYPDRFFE